MFQTGTFWLLLPCCVAAYWAIPVRMRITFLAMVSMGYIAWLTPLNALALFGWSILFYWLAPLAAKRRRTAAVKVAVKEAPQRLAANPGLTLDGAATTIALDRPAAPPAHSPRERRWVLWALILGILGYLAVFKGLRPILNLTFSGAGASTYLIPLGISYFTFKFIHYAVEVARGNIRDRSPAQFLAYVFLFPTFTAGPIERFDHFLANQKTRWSLDLFTEGTTRLIHGLIKKFVVAEMFFGETFRYANSGRLLARLSSTPPHRVWWLGIVSYLYVYMDFAGYSDMAIGASRLLGLGIMENFDAPIMATNIAAFWKRWHMTLTGWCQSYVYMPVLGLTRKPNLATYAAFVVIGLWHAASWPWLFWGVYHGSGIVVYGAWTRLKRRRKWTWMDQGRRKYASAALGMAATTLFIAAGELITFGGLQTGHDTLRVIAKLALINIK